MVLEKKVDGATIGSGEGREGLGRLSEGDIGGDTVSHALEGVLTFGTITPNIDLNMEMLLLTIVNHHGKKKLKRVEGGSEASNEATRFGSINKESNVDNPFLFFDLDLVLSQTKIGEKLINEIIVLHKTPYLLEGEPRLAPTVIILRILLA